MAHEITATVTINVHIDDGSLGGQAAGTTLTLSLADLKALGYRWRQTPDDDTPPADDDAPASADVTVAFLGALADDHMDAILSMYRDAGGTV